MLLLNSFNFRRGIRGQFGISREFLSLFEEAESMQLECISVFSMCALDVIVTVFMGETILSSRHFLD